MGVQAFWGMLLVFTQAAMGWLFQDPVVCRFNESNQCYVAVGQQLHLPMPPVEKFNLKITNKTFHTRTITSNRLQSHQQTHHLIRWQFDTDNKMLIITSAETSDSGNYSLQIFSSEGTTKGTFTVQVNIEAQAASVHVSYSCLSAGVKKVDCSADGDNLRFSWTADSGPVYPLEDGKSSFLLEEQHRNVICRVENHVSSAHGYMELQPCFGLLFQDPVVCRFNENNQCYVAVGQRLHLPMPQEEKFNLKITNKTFHTRTITPNRLQSHLQTHNLTRWQFDTDNKMLIITSAETSDSGNYSLEIFSSYGTTKGTFTVQVNIEAQAASVHVSYSCLSGGVKKVDCSADGDNLRFSWTAGSGLVYPLEDGKSSFLLEERLRNVTCRAENHVSSAHGSMELQPCLGFTVFVSVWLCEVIILLSLLVGGFYIYRKIRKTRTDPKPPQDFCSFFGLISNALDC